MPELPEVETMRRAVAVQVTGKRIIDIYIADAKAVDDPNDLFSFCNIIQGTTIKSVGRRGKYLIFYLDNGGAFLVHFAMSGRLHTTPPDKLWLQKLPRHARVSFLLEDICLHFVDPRHFGGLRAVPADKLKNYYIIKQIGPEPSSKKFSATYMIIQASKKKWGNKPIKKIIMDQQFVAGVGNIYASEALFRAEIVPHRLLEDLSFKEAVRLRQSIKDILNEAIAGKGTSFDHGYEGGGFQEFLKVYGKKNCPSCQGHLEIDKLIDNRTTYWCSKCQK